MLDRFDGFIGSDSGSTQTDKEVQLSGSIKTLVGGESVQKITTTAGEVKFISLNAIFVKFSIQEAKLDNNVFLYQYFNFSNKSDKYF